MTEKQKNIDNKEADDKQPEEKPIDPHTTDWESIEDADFIKFENIGDTLEGMLIEKGSSTRYSFGLYEITTKTGDRKRFHGTKQLDSLMKGVNIQDYIKIEYVDNEEVPEGLMKIFTVDRKK